MLASPDVMTASAEVRSEDDASLQRVLIVEDNALGQLALKIVLDQLCMQLRIVSDGRDAIEAVIGASLSGIPFDLVIMDIHLPVLDGVSAVRQLRDYGHFTPVLAISADTSDNCRSRAFSAGCMEFLAKPFTCASLHLAVRQALHKSRAT
jgi:CheY-like chemotaxis protein